MSVLVLIRHGETEMRGRFCGQSNPELNSAGELDVARVAEEVAQLGIKRICSSDLLRASQTASALARRIGISVETRQSLREIHFGLWEGLYWQEIEAQFPQEANRWLQEFPMRSAPGGESYTDFTARVEATIATILCEAAGQTTAVVTHRGVMRYALTRLFGFNEPEAWTATAAYASVVIVRDCGNRLRKATA